MAEPNMSPEQMKELQEKIKNMSPEELKEFQKKQCIFCQIVAGKIQAKKIYEDDRVLVILDINPANPGHALILTKEHYSIMPQIPDDEISYVFMVVKSLSNTMLRSIDAHGTNVIVANGIAAGQRAQHFMVHLIPRKENDGVNFTLPQKTMQQEEIEAVGNKIVASLTGAPQKEEIQMPKINFPEKKINGQKLISEEKSEKAKSGIDLDDIAKLLGAK